MSKGSKPRPYDINKYGENYDRIFRKEKKEEIKEKEHNKHFYEVVKEMEEII